MLAKAQSRFWLAPAVLSCAAWLGTAPAAAEDQNPIEIDEWKVPFEGRARDPFAAGDDEVWFVGQRGHYLARFTPSSGEFTKKDLPDEAGPHNLIVDSSGVVWYAGNLRGYIGRYDPRADEITKIEMPDAAARDPHTLVFDEGEEHIWFTVQGGNFIGRLALDDHAVDLVPVPTQRARPYGIKIAGDGTPWAVLLGTNKLASIDPETLALTEHEIPHEAARPRRLEITEDGRIWYADTGRGYLGMYDPAADAFEEWALPGGERSQPYGMASDENGRVWVVETGVRPNRFIGFDTEREEIVSITTIPSGAGAVRHMHYHEPTGTVWFGTDEETLGRAAVRAE
jgi:virginiamycin B lyase